MVLGRPKEVIEEREAGRAKIVCILRQLMCCLRAINMKATCLTEDLTTFTTDLGFSVLSTHNFNDIRAGDPQTFIIWGTSSSGTNSSKYSFPTRADNTYSAV